MTTIQVTLHDGTTFTEQVENYDPTETKNILNDPRLLVVQLGVTIVSKNAVKLIVPVQA